MSTAGASTRRKQEQEPASDEVVEVATGVLRTQLPINFTGLGHVNMYCLLDHRGAAVVDPGLPGADSWRSVVAALRRASLDVRHVHTVVITHSHPDHFGGAARLADEAGADVVTHESFFVPYGRQGPDVTSFDDGSIDEMPTEPVRTQDGMAVPWRRPGDLLAPPRLPGRAGPATAGGSAPPPDRWAMPTPTPTVPLGAGATIRLAERDWIALHTPGHTADHLCLHDPSERLLLSGDHVLPTITPHVSGMGCGPDPLRSYLDALAAVGRLDVVRALPAHGEPFTNLAERTAAITEHHEQRLGQIVAFGVAEGAASVEAYMRALFPPHHWGLMAESEVFAHLEHLRRTGRVTARREDGVVLYQVVPG